MSGGWRTRELLSAGVYFAILLACIGHFGILAIGIASLALSLLLTVLFLPISIRRYRMMARID